MSGLEIKHFLVTYDPESDQTKVEDFGTDYDGAQAAYAQAERVSGFETKLDIVLLSADSLETIKQTHSSYFSSGVSRLRELLAELSSASVGGAVPNRAPSAHPTSGTRGNRGHLTVPESRAQSRQTPACGQS